MPSTVDPATSSHDSPGAIVLGVEHPRAVAVVRSLGRMGVPVVGVDHIRTARGMYSRYLRETIVVGERHDDVLATLSSLTAHRGAMLIATNDHYLTLVSQHFERLSERFILTTPPWDIVGSLMDKRRCYELARSIGLGVPAFFHPTTVEELEQVITALDFTQHDYILSKAMPVAEPTDRSTRRFTRVAGLDAATVRARCLEVFGRTGELPMVVEVVPGSSDTCVGVSMVLDRRLDPVASYCVKRLQLRPYVKDEGFVHPYELGANVYCQSIHDDEAVDATRRLLQAAGHYGVATVEFRRDALRGTLKLVKVDPRFVRATSLSAALGPDLPRALFRVFAGQSADVPQVYPAGVSWIWPSWYLDTLWRQGLGVVARRLVLLLRDRTIGATAYLSLDDPMPAVVDVRKWARQYARDIWRWLRRTRLAAGALIRSRARSA